MRKEITSKEVQQQLKITRPELSCLVRLGIIKPNKKRVNYFLYSIKQINRILNLKTSKDGI